VIYKNLCDLSNNKIIKNFELCNGIIDIFIIDTLKRAYSDKEYAIYEDFILNKQWKLFTNYSGIYKKYDFTFDDDGYLCEDYFHNNGNIEGTYKKYCKCCGLICEINYINGKKYGYTNYYKHKTDCYINNNDISESRNYITDNYYERKINNEETISYYYMDINISWFVRLKKIIFS
jgi:hypothetical protein